MNKLKITPFLILFLLLLVACGGASEEAPAESVETEEETTIEEESIEEEEAPAEEEAVDDPIQATGSEDDSSPLPPPINSGSKVTANSEEPAVDVLFIIENSEDTAVTTAELEEEWDDTVEQINALPTQPDVRYASIRIESGETQPFTLTDFSNSPTWDDLLAADGVADTTIDSITDTFTQLSWLESESAQIVFILVSPEQFDGSLLIESDTAVYFPIITEEMALAEGQLLNYDAIMEMVNGRLIQFEEDDQTTLSEQIILAIAETISETNE